MAEWRHSQVFETGNMLEPMSRHLPVRPMSGVEIAQTHRQFSPRVTVITVGTSMAFPNRDTVRHHVYSFSPVKTFELSASSPPKVNVRSLKLRS